MPVHPAKTRCTIHNGRAWAVRGSDPPLCSTHAGCTVGAVAQPGSQNARAHGVYASAITHNELADLLTYAAGTNISHPLTDSFICFPFVDRPLPPDDCFQEKKETRVGQRPPLPAARVPSRLIALTRLSAEWGIER